MYRKIVHKNERVKFLYDEDSRENEEDKEWSILSKIRGLGL